MSEAVVKFEVDMSGFVATVKKATDAFRKFADAFGGRESWAKPSARERREQRRADAVKRQKRYDATPTFDKLAAIAERRGLSVQERERLLSRLA